VVRTVLPDKKLQVKLCAGVRKRAAGRAGRQAGRQAVGQPGKRQRQPMRSRVV
jgi:hypothetical protein